ARSPGTPAAAARSASDLPRTALPPQRQCRRQAVGELADRGADRGHLALYVSHRRRHDKSEIAQRRPGPPLEADAGLGLQNQITGRVLVEPLEVELDRRVGRGRHRSALTENSALRQTLTQLL